MLIMETFIIALTVMTILGALGGLLFSHEDERLFNVGFWAMGGFSLTCFVGIVLTIVHFVSKYW